MTKDPSVSFLRECLSYNPVNGELIWLPRPINHFATKRVFNTWHSRFCGKVAGRLNDKGYIEIGMQGRRVKAHRAAWAIFHGYIAAGDIDHINGVRNDNRIDNLRVVDRTGNSRNSAKHKNNVSGLSGVYWRERDKRWIALISFNGIQKHLGQFKCLLDAAAVRKAAEILHGYHLNHGR